VIVTARAPRRFNAACSVRARSSMSIVGDVEMKA
jgi:hypothetical protein